MLRPIDSPLTLFLIGATGDLAKKKIWAAIYKLFQQSLLPTEFSIIGKLFSKTYISLVVMFLKLKPLKSFINIMQIYLTVAIIYGMWPLYQIYIYQSFAT